MQIDFNPNKDYFIKEFIIAINKSDSDPIFFRNMISANIDVPDLESRK